MSFSSDVKNTLYSEIDAMASTPELYCINPNKDFARTRKISFRDIISLPIVMESGTLRYLFIKKKPIMVGSGKNNPAWLYLGLDLARMSDEQHKLLKATLQDIHLYCAYKIHPGTKGNGIQ